MDLGIPLLGKGKGIIGQKSRKSWKSADLGTFRAVWARAAERSKKGPFFGAGLGSSEGVIFVWARGKSGVLRRGSPEVPDLARSGAGGAGGAGGAPGAPRNPRARGNSAHFWEPTLPQRLFFWTVGSASGFLGCERN